MDTEFKSPDLYILPIFPLKDCFSSIVKFIFTFKRSSRTELHNSQKIFTTVTTAYKTQQNKNERL